MKNTRKNNGSFMKIRESTRKDADQFPVIVELNDGPHYLIMRAAVELRDKLASVIANIKKKEPHH